MFLIPDFNVLTHRQLISTQGVDTAVIGHARTIQTKDRLNPILSKNCSSFNITLEKTGNLYIYGVLFNCTKIIRKVSHLQSLNLKTVKKEILQKILPFYKGNSLPIGQ